MAKASENREQELQKMAVTDFIQLVRVYQNVIGTPNGQVPIPGIASTRMIEVILKRSFRRRPHNSGPPRRL